MVGGIRAAVGLLEQRGDELGHGPRARIGAHALQQRGQQRVVLHALRERVERVVRQHAQRERQVRPGRHELREHDRGARHLVRVRVRVRVRVKGEGEG